METQKEKKHNWLGLKLGITRKLSIIFLFFILIFYGTLVVLFLNVQQMIKTSEQIVGINNRISELSTSMQESLLAMEVNDKKYRLLGKEMYRGYFESARTDFEAALKGIVGLESPHYRLSGRWNEICKTYGAHPKGTGLKRKGSAWAREETVNGWIRDLTKARLENEIEIENALISINARSKGSLKKGLLGLGLSVLMAVLGVVVVSRSMLTPLKALTRGVKILPGNKTAAMVETNARDEFGELAAAFNEMSRQLKEEEDLRSDFIASLSHEIRTPLSSIRESVNMIMEEVLGPVNQKQQKFLHIADAEIARISDLFDHLLHLSRLESKVQQVRFLPINPNRLMAEASEILVPRAEKKEIRLTLHPMAEPPMVMGGEKEILQVLLNIIGNAIKFSYKGGTIDIHTLAAPGAVRFRIADDGPGIPEGEAALIFNKYYRSREIRNHMDGVGLGLNISRKIVAFHHGEIWMENHSGKGCSFYFTLPCPVEGQQSGMDENVRI
ncbi:MAG: HAMP domain-containing histidine kinase [Desulfobacterium sp.]|nr:HAMP domain-containing histidine kinase [Desulfobacterium sp.]